MSNSRPQVKYVTFFIILAFMLLMAGCAAKVTTGVFPPVDNLEKQIQRGISTKMDVQKLLGAPDGLGSALFPIDPHPRKVWYYDDIETTDFQSEKGGILRVNVRQQILLVFFKNGVFDGFMWFSNSGMAVAEKP
jgi:hypothetical protein